MATLIVGSAPAAADPSDQLPFTGTYKVSNTWNIKGGHKSPALDFAMPVGTPVRATGSGEVLAADWQACGGNNIAIYHSSENRSSQYVHLSRMNVKPGTKVRRGDVIGLSGNTGSCTTGPNLHYQEMSGRQPEPLGERRLDPGVMYGCKGNKTLTYNNWPGRVWFSVSSDGMGCRKPSAPPGKDPTGVFDEASSPGRGQIRVRGWGFDPDAKTKPLSIDVYVGGPAGSVPGKRFTANKSRPDVGRAYPGVGNNHGFDEVVPAKSGATVKMYVYLINAPGTGGRHHQLNVRTVKVK